MFLIKKKAVAFSQHRQAFGVFTSRQDVEFVLQQLKYIGFSSEKISLITKQPDRQQRLYGDQTTRQLVDQALAGNITGTVKGLVRGNICGSFTGLLLGLSTLAIPGIGHLILAQATGTVIAYALSSSAIGIVAGGLAGALIGLGITEQQAKVYSEQVLSGGYLVIVSGTDDEIRRAESILKPTKVEGISKTG